MSNNKTYKAIEVCNELNISINTLTNWYRWQNNLLKNGEITKKDEYQIYQDQMYILHNLIGNPYLKN